MGNENGADDGAGVFDAASFVRDRDEMLLSLDFDRMKAYCEKCGSPVPPSRQVALVAMHKARTGALSLPWEARLLSARWLIEHGFSTMDDGDLRQAAANAAEQQPPYSS